MTRTARLFIFQLDTIYILLSTMKDFSNFYALVHCWIYKFGNAATRSVTMFNYLESVVDIMTRLQTGRSGVRIPAKGRVFLYPKRAYRPWDPPSLIYNGYRCSFPGVKRPGDDVDHSPAASVEVKNERSYTSTPTCMLSWRGQGQLYCFDPKTWV
jgi:hypothetical protein